jgi:thioredoxin-related protein
MKKILLFSLFMTTFFCGKAQVNFDTYPSLTALFDKAKTEKKLVFIQLESTECNQCNDVAKKRVLY